LPTFNFRLGRFDQAENFNGKTLYRTIVERGGDPSHACMPLHYTQFKYLRRFGWKAIVRSLEYETLVLFGSNCGISDLDELARINHLCNDIGIDSIDLGVATGIAMEAGLLPSAIVAC